MKYQAILQAKHSGVALEGLFDFSDGVLKNNPGQRMSAEEALKHKWLQEE